MAPPPAGECNDLGGARAIRRNRLASNEMLPPWHVVALIRFEPAIEEAFSSTAIRLYSGLGTP